MRLILSICLLAFSFSVLAKDGPRDYKLPETDLLATICDAPAAPITASMPSTNRQHHKLASNYNGFLIELIESEVQLPLNHPLFKQFGGIQYTKLDNGHYSYCIVAEFTSRKAIESFVSHIVQPKANAAKVLTYKKGKRLKR